MRLPIIFIVCIILLSLLIDWRISHEIKSLEKKRIFNYIYLSFSCLCYAFLLCILLLPRKSADFNIDIIKWGLFAYISIYAAKLVCLLSSFIGNLIYLLRRKHQLSKRKYKVTSLYIGAILGFVLCCSIFTGALYTRYQIDVKYVTLNFKTLPENFDNFRIVQFSDAHVDCWGNDTSFVYRLVDSINLQKPDLILFTGDIVSRKSTELLPFVRTFSRLHAKYGVYSVLGNHDYGDYINWKSPGEKEDNMRLMYQLQRKMGWHLLDNETKYIKIGNDSIALIGVGNWGEPPFKTYGSLDLAIAKDPQKESLLQNNTFKILLSHNPEHWNQIVSKTSNINLTLSGHTHAMQMAFKIGGVEFSPASMRYPQWSGLYEREFNRQQSLLYVNIGAGEVAMPARFGVAYPEITVFTLKSVDND